MSTIQIESRASISRFNRNALIATSIAAIFLVGLIGWNARREPVKPQNLAELSSPIRLLNIDLTSAPSFESETMRADALRFADTFVNSFKQAEHLAVPQS
ncbi:MAG TPA: hypothetical protein PK402_13520 [Tepidisphaeraceae bacterium]|nr:hypothetical protein [Tepidisphaeraceae bacterium]